MIYNVLKIITNTLLSEQNSFISLTFETSLKEKHSCCTVRQIILKALENWVFQEKARRICYKSQFHSKNFLVVAVYKLVVELSFVLFEYTNFSEELINKNREHGLYWVVKVKGKNQLTLCDFSIHIYEILGHMQMKHLNEKCRRDNYPKITSASHTCIHSHRHIIKYKQILNLMCLYFFGYS